LLSPRLGVLGWPVAHSRSPQLPNAALRAAGLAAWRYQLLPVPPGLFAEVVRALPGIGFRGANVTIPHKEAALVLASHPTDRARQIGAANTLVFETPDHVVAENTDAPALIEALPVPPAGLEALVLGAGGSARAAVWALIDAGANVRVWNRRPERAESLCAELGGSPVREAAPADLLVNCTPVGLDGSGTLTGLPLTLDAIGDYGCVADLVYTQGGTALINGARRAGVHTVDGLELLIAQGALSFEHFTGRSAPRAAMRSAAGLERPRNELDP
jgi:shikimate dehydrogenase